MSASFVGTEEDADENHDDPVDAIESPADLRDPDPNFLDIIDQENDMLDKFPLPGNPKSEVKRKQKWLGLTRRHDLL